MVVYRSFLLLLVWIQKSVNSKIRNFFSIIMIIIGTFLGHSEGIPGTFRGETGGVAVHKQFGGYIFLDLNIFFSEYLKIS